MTTRREFVLASLALWDAALARAQEHRHAAATTGSAADLPYRFTFLTAGERATLRQAMALLIPADERSGGAVGAKVDEYVDFVMTHADAGLQQTWRGGLARMAQAKDMDAFLAVQARREFSPQTEDEAFFGILKDVVCEGFYTSAEGVENELGYRGMTFAVEFDGCTHDAHVAPANWQPELRQKNKG
jgi:hypothetical protein